MISIKLFCIFQLSTLDQVTTNITLIYAEALKKIFHDKITNATLEREVSKLADDIKAQSSTVKQDLDGIRDKVDKISLDKVLDTAKTAEFYR